MDLDVKVYQAGCRSEEAPYVALMGIKELPRTAYPYDPGDETIFEEALEDGSALKIWAFFYGMAYAIERIECPLDSEDRWQERARLAADKATSWHHNVRGQEGRG
jgi:hypothetical protein